MYKLYAFIFFILNIGTVGILFLNSRLIFHTDFGKILFFIYLLVYVSFALIFVSKSFVEIKKDNVVTKLSKKLLSVFPFLSKVGKGGSFVRTIIALLIYFFIIGIAFGGVYRYAIATVPSLLKETNLFRNYTTAAVPTKNYSPEISKLTLEMRDFKERHFEETRKVFFANNERVYSSSDDLYTLYLSFQNANMSQNGFDSRMSYKVRICNTTDICSDAWDGDAVKDSPYILGYMDFASNEVIEDMSFERYETSFTSEPFFVVRVTTNSELYYGIIYPSSIDAKHQYYLSSRTLDDTSEIFNTLLDVSEEDTSISFSFERHIVTYNTSSPEIEINDTRNFGLKFSPTGNKVQVLYVDSGIN